jgi:uncharacterized protein (DUF2267 family)
MSTAGYSVIDTTVAKTNQVLKQIEKSEGWPKEHRELSYHALRAVLHALRDRLTPKEASDFAAQLPMLIRGLFYEGWNPAKVPKKMDKEEFIERIRQEFIYKIDQRTEQLIGIVFSALKPYITKGELDDIKSVLPKDIAVLLP